MAKKAKKAATKHDGTGRSKTGAADAQEPKNIPVPDEAIIKRPQVTDPGAPEQTSPTVKGDQRITIMDNLQGKAVEVFVIDGQHLNPDVSGKLVFIQGAVSNELLPEAQARSRFALKKDGTVIYNSRGFDDVPARADYDMVDIVKLVELNAKK
jgi:hypothetical protein